MSDEVRQRCPAGHTWLAAMFYETGGWFYLDETQAYCPQCGQEALEEDGAL